MGLAFPIRWAAMARGFPDGSRLTSLSLTAVGETVRPCGYPPSAGRSTAWRTPSARRGRRRKSRYNHPEGIKGATATAAAIWLARTGESKASIRAYVSKSFDYDLARTCDDIRSSYSFDESSQGTVPEAIIAFLDSANFEDAIRLAISLGGDADTLACITGGIAQAFYRKIPDYMIVKAREVLDPSLIPIVDEFNERFSVEKMTPL